MKQEAVTSKSEATVLHNSISRALKLNATFSATVAEDFFANSMHTVQKQCETLSPEAVGSIASLDLSSALLFVLHGAGGGGQEAGLARRQATGPRTVKPGLKPEIKPVHKTYKTSKTRRSNRRK